MIMEPSYSASVEYSWCRSRVHTGPQSDEGAAWGCAWCKENLQLQEWTDFHFLVKAFMLEVVAK